MPAVFTLTVEVSAPVLPEEYEAVGLAVLRHVESLAWAIRDAPELRGKGAKVSVQPLTVKSAP